MGLFDLDKAIEKWASKYKEATQDAGNSKPAPSQIEIVYDKVKVKVIGQKKAEASASDFPDCGCTQEEKPSVVFKSTYTNNTSMPQEHRFKMERTTSARVSYKIKEGFTRNGMVGLTLQVPDAVTNATGGFGADVAVDTEEESLVHHSLSWGIDSKVTVPAKTTTVAKLEVIEEEMKCGFSAFAKLRGTVVVRVLDGSTGQFKMAVQNDIATLLQDLKGEIPNSVKIEDGRVLWPVEGSFHFKFGVSQQSTVDYVEATKESSNK